MGILDKLTTRNFLALGTGITFWGLLAYILVLKIELLENPIVTGMLGSFLTVTALVYQFYFRTSGPSNVGK